MAYKTYEDQVREHIDFLRSNGLDTTELKVDANFIRCHAKDSTSVRGELTYKTTSSKLENGLFGLATWCRGVGGVSNFSTYGLEPNGVEVENAILAPVASISIADSTLHEVAACKAYGFWQYSSLHGTSDYLTRKQVGSYGIRFRSSEQYGNAAVVPMFDEFGRLWNRELLNSDGSKRFAPNARTEGLFHSLQAPKNAQPIGIAESYVTAATCTELAKIPVVCAFSCHNLKSVALTMRKLYPDSALILFADNDRHLEINQGILKAKEAVEEVKKSIVMVSPDFGGLPASKDMSDWNDLVRVKDESFVKQQLQVNLSKF